MINSRVRAAIGFVLFAFSNSGVAGTFYLESITSLECPYHNTLQIIYDPAPEGIPFANGGLSIELVSDNPDVIRFLDAEVVNDGRWTAGRIRDLYHVGIARLLAFSILTPGMPTERPSVFATLDYEVVGTGTTNLTLGAFGLDPLYDKGIDVSAETRFENSALFISEIPDPCIPNPSHLSVAGDVGMLPSGTSTGVIDILYDPDKFGYGFREGGLSLELSSSQPGVIRFTSVEIVDEDRWALVSAAGTSGDDAAIMEVLAFDTPGLPADSPSVFARITYEVIGIGTTELSLSPANLGPIEDGIPSNIVSVELLGNTITVTPEPTSLTLAGLALVLFGPRRPAISMVYSG